MAKLARPVVMRSLLVALAATACVGHFRAQATPVSPVPDFYQHQGWLPAIMSLGPPVTTKANPNASMSNPGLVLWEGWNAFNYKANPVTGWNAPLNELMKGTEGGFCWYAAVVDALYPWTQYKDSNGMAPFANLFGNGSITKSGFWVTASETAMLAMRGVGKKTGAPRGATSINAFLDSLNFGPTANKGGVALTDTSFTVAGNGTVMVKLAGRTEATTISPIALAEMAYNDGLTDVVTITPTSPPDSSLWWSNSFHTMAIGGLGGRPNQLLVADPDSVPINAGNSNGGFWNTSTIASAKTLDAKNTAATDSLNAAIAAVDANIYTNLQAQGPTPVPGAGEYTAANLYGSITLSSIAGQQNLITAASNVNYGDKTMVSSFDVINTLAMTQMSIRPAQLAGKGPAASTITATAGYRDTFAWTGEIASDVEQIEIFPVVALADSNFTFTEPGWTESLITTDPFGGIWSGGGEDIDVTAAGSDLVPGEIADTTLDTTAPADQYNVFFQLADGDWTVQAFGAANNAFGDQALFPVPEPGTLPLLATGLAGLLGYGWRRRKTVG